MDKFQAMAGTAVHWELNNGPFLCKICSKPFTRRTTPLKCSPRHIIRCCDMSAAWLLRTRILGLSRNRHVLYCRKKLGPDEPVLRKSCVACRKAKAKCNSSLPYCRRCAEKTLNCVYEATQSSKGTLNHPNARYLNHDCAPGVELVENGNQHGVFREISSQQKHITLANLEPDLAVWTAKESDKALNGAIHLDIGFIQGVPTSTLIPPSDPEVFFDDLSSSGWSFLGLHPSLAFNGMFHNPNLAFRPIDRYQSAYSSRSSSSLTSPRTPFIPSYVSA